jgi:hypothetical protein
VFSEPNKRARAALPTIEGESREDREGPGRDLFDAVQRLDLQLIVAKRLVIWAARLGTSVLWYLDGGPPRGIYACLGAGGGPG